MTSTTHETDLAEQPQLEQGQYTPSTPINDQGKWITDGAWISGVVGIFTLFLMAFLCQKFHWLDRGVNILGWFNADSSLNVKLFCLIVVALSMCFTELIRLTVSGHKPLFVFAPELAQGNILRILFISAWRYFCYLILFILVLYFYKAVPEYGVLAKKTYYVPWFRMSDWLFTAFLWLGFPYVLLTYALKYDKEKDKNSYHHLIQSLLIGILVFTKLSSKPELQSASKAQLKKIFLGLLVRVFFVPLMTVFFVTQFSQLISNMSYVLDSLPRNIAIGNYSHSTFNTDLLNISKAIIFSIDVGLAWCGYVFTSRWLDNETQSTEPTLMGWFVCLISYPPLRIAGLYFYFPSENQMLNIQNEYFVTFFGVLMISSFVIYTFATLVFGVRFSNLTHRGIIRTGPFAIIRHPAYTSKNIGWWLGIFPVLLYLYAIGKVQFSFVLLSTIALVGQSYWYYLRAITEERHLSIDPAYRQYCEKVRYRFIPGVL